MFQDETTKYWETGQIENIRAKLLGTPRLDIDSFVKSIANLPYFERRIALHKLIQPNQTRFLYKYRNFSDANSHDLSRVKDIVVSGKLWMASPHDFNDPFDMAAHIEAIGPGRTKRKRLLQILKDGGLKFKHRKALAAKLMKESPIAFNQRLNAVYQGSLADFGVCSFAGDPRSILMWSHYAANHRGICIQIERARDYNQLAAALAVEYSEKYPEINWLNKFWESLSEVVLQKYSSWGYEKEERIILVHGARKAYVVDPNAITAIILGCRFPLSHRKYIDELIDERTKNGLLPLRVFQAQRAAKNYQLLLKKVL